MLNRIHYYHNFIYIFYSILFVYSGFRWTLSQFIMQKADMGMKSPVDMMYFSQPWMFITIFPISIFFEGKIIIFLIYILFYYDKH